MTKTLLMFMAITLCIACKSDPEKKESTTSTSIRPDYIAYQSHISMAEKHILDSIYVDALKEYETAFTLVEKPLAKHCFTAMQVSATVDSLDHFKKYSIAGMKRGLLPKYYKEDSLLNAYLKQKDLYDFIDEHFEPNHKIYEESTNTFLIDTLKQLTLLDQKWKVHYWDSLARVDPINKPKYDSLYNIVISDIVENKLIPLIKEFGYPGERLIGASAVGYDPNDSYRRAYVQNSAKLILWHYYSLPRQKCEYNDLFWEEVTNGNLDPGHYATFIDFQARKGADTICNNVKIYDQHFTVTDSTRFDEFNTRRAQLGLEPIEERNKKYKRGQKACKEIKEGNFKHIKLFYWCG
ncbi:hypothetical protein P278_24210 [Zhouia amylolytica AD3]|uniref:Uncharacterized protein n=2 Tax=Zhouia amylolytica TaxID=376730 RepID=W2UKE7_9FLAO|nr:hypothetical protein P278_24210 [Zhouia amylolytica AD3]